MSRGDCTKCNEELRNGAGLCHVCEGELRVRVAELETMNERLRSELASLDALADGAEPTASVGVTLPTSAEGEAAVQRLGIDVPSWAAQVRERVAGACSETPVVCSHPSAHVSDYSTIGGTCLRWCASCGSLHDEDGWTMPTGGTER